jgi:hypothetical protein
MQRATALVLSSEAKQIAFFPVFEQAGRLRTRPFFCARQM